MKSFPRHQVVDALTQAGRPLKPQELLRVLGIHPNRLKAFRAFLRELESRGELYRVKQGRYAPPERLNLVLGRLAVVSNGDAYLAPEGPGEDIHVSARALATGLHGDRVMVRPERRRGSRREGRVVRVLERARTTFVGTVRRTRHSVRVAPDDPKFPGEVFVPGDSAQDVADGAKVMVEIVEWGSDRSDPVGRIRETLGMPGEVGLDVLVIIKHNDLATDFPADVEKAAKGLPARIPSLELEHRLDLRDTPVVTIDPESARDFDDALSLVPLRDGNLELGIHIADVSHYVQHGDVIDQEARRRGTSVYLVDRVIPMLPERLSNDLCSLNPNVDRLAQSVLVTITPRGRVLGARIEDTVIRSTRRFSYEQVQSYFDGKAGGELDGSGLQDLLDPLRSLATTLTTRRVRRGSLDFDLPESRVDVDADGVPVDIQKVERLESHRLVEVFMLLANEVVARELRGLQLGGLFRVHEAPAPGKLDDLREHLAGLGYELGGDKSGEVPPKSLQRVLRQSEGTPEERIVQTLVLRSLARARYDVSPRGHYALVLRDYAHFTSPIRRYPDLLVHRVLRWKAQRQKPPAQVAAGWREWLAETAVLTSERERVAENAERDSVALKKIEFMERHVGDVFGGTITGVESFGFFVEIDDYFVSGLVHLNRLEDDYYEHRERELSLVGRSTGRRFTLGDRVRVEVLATKKELRQIDFLILEGGAITEKPGDRARRHHKAGRGRRVPRAKQARNEKGRRKQGQSQKGRGKKGRDKRR